MVGLRIWSSGRGKGEGPGWLEGEYAQCLCTKTFRERAEG